MATLTMTTAPTPTGFCAMCDALPGWVVGESGDFEKFKAYVKESVAFYIDGFKERGLEVPPELQGEIDIVYHFDVQATLSELNSIFTFAALERITGINQKQLSNYATRRSQPRPRQAEKISNALHALADRLHAVRF